MSAPNVRTLYIVLHVSRVSALHYASLSTASAPANLIMLETKYGISRHSVIGCRIIAHPEQSITDIGRQSVAGPILAPVSCRKSSEERLFIQCENVKGMNHDVHEFEEVEE